MNFFFNILKTIISNKKNYFNKLMLSLTFRPIVKLGVLNDSIIEKKNVYNSILRNLML